jgi:galacturan 1,4-alpha-galacturonidase
MYIEGKSSSITISDLKFQNAPNVFHSVTGDSSNIIYSGLNLYAVAVDGVRV